MTFKPPADHAVSSKTLVTGATGFVGRALCARLAVGHEDVRALVRGAASDHVPAALSGIELCIGDLLQPQTLDVACAGRDVVVHLASVAHVNQAQHGEARRAIVEGTGNLLGAAVRQNVKRLVFISSSLAHAAEAGAGDVTPYGEYKYAAEQLLLDANKEGLIEVVILRPVNVYGEGMQGNIAGMISRIARGRLPPLPALATRLSLLGAIDLARAIELAMHKEGIAGQTYTVTDGQEYKIKEIEQAIYAALGKQFPGWRTPRMVLFAAALGAELLARLGLNRSAIGLRTYRNITHDNLFDNTAICRDLGFQPQSGFYQELPRIVENILQKLPGVSQGRD